LWFIFFCAEQKNNSGWAYVYYLNQNETSFELDAEVVSPVGNNSYFGSGVGITENAIIVGADGFRKFYYIQICPFLHL
jgi:hypothetical protein